MQAIQRFFVEHNLTISASAPAPTAAPESAMSVSDDDDDDGDGGGDADARSSSSGGPPSVVPQSTSPPPSAANPSTRSSQPPSLSLHQFQVPKKKKKRKKEGRKGRKTDGNIWKRIAYRKVMDLKCLFFILARPPPPSLFPFIFFSSFTFPSCSACVPKKKKVLGAGKWAHELATSHSSVWQAQAIRRCGRARGGGSLTSAQAASAGSGRGQRRRPQCGHRGRDPEPAVGLVARPAPGLAAACARQLRRAAGGHQHRHGLLQGHV
mgnify:CR=1 FL=1